MSLQTCQDDFNKISGGSHLANRNRGSIYFLVLASALILVSLGVGLSHMFLQFRQTSRSNSDIHRAEVYAELGIQHALHGTTAISNWRAVLSNGDWLDEIPVDDATYSVTGIDPCDGTLQDSDGDPVTLTCTATIHGVSRTMAVQTQQLPLELLRYALAAEGLINLDHGHTRITGDVTTNADIDKSGADTWIFGNAEAVGTIDEVVRITGIIAPGSAPKTFPDDQRILQYYQSRATNIGYLDTIEKVLLSPTSNPFGAPDADGLYKINCSNKKIVIKDCRIVGTLLLINPKSDSTIDSAINWRPARPDYPALIIMDGDFTIKPDRDLVELALGVDFSMPGEPGFGFQLGIFPNVIEGVVYSNGNLELDKDCNIQGTVVCAGEVKLKDWTACTHDPAVLATPPECFRESYLVPIQGTWEQVIP